MSLTGLLEHATASWASEAVLHRVLNSREHQNLHYEAHVALEQRYGDLLNTFAPDKDSILVLGAGYR
jgi:hypothetical protein